MRKKAVLAFIVFALIALSNIPLFAVAQVQNIVVSPSPPDTDGDITVTFQVRSDNGSSVNFGVGLSKITAAGDNEACKVNYLALEDGIYRGDFAGTTYWWIDGVSQTATTLDITDVHGIDSGLNSGVSDGTTWKNISIITHIPPEQAGAGYYINVFARQSGSNFNYECCGDGQNQDVHPESAQFTIVGLPFLKTNLMMCDAGSVTDGTAPCSNDQLKVGIVIENWGQSGFNLEGFSIKYCFYDTNTSFETQASTNFQAHWPSYSSGANYCNVFNPSSESVGVEIAAVDCGNNRMANKCWVVTYHDSSQRPYFIPPDGGYFQTGSPYTWFRRTGSNCWNTTDDYARVTEMNDCDSHSNYMYVPLYWNGVMMCEWTSQVMQDPLTGTESCNGSECSDYITLQKSVNLGVGESRTPRAAMIGDTITYCVTFTNTTGDLILTFNLWDSIPAISSFVSCDTSANTYIDASGCQTVTVGSRTIVYWRSNSIPPGGWGTVCFAVRIDAYPWMPFEHSIFGVLKKHMPYS